MRVTLEELKKKADSEGYTLVEVKFKPDVDFCGTTYGHELAEGLNAKATTLYALTDHDNMIILYEHRETFESEVNTPLGVNPQFFYDTIF
jgi:hypothetical protein